MVKSGRVLKLVKEEIINNVFFFVEFWLFFFVFDNEGELQISRINNNFTAKMTQKTLNNL